jgi:hypothetical protein
MTVEVLSPHPAGNYRALVSEETDDSGDADPAGPHRARQHRSRARAARQEHRQRELAADTPPPPASSSAAPLRHRNPIVPVPRAAVLQLRTGTAFMGDVRAACPLKSSSADSARLITKRRRRVRRSSRPSSLDGICQAVHEHAPGQRPLFMHECALATECRPRRSFFLPSCGRPAGRERARAVRKAGGDATASGGALSSRVKHDFRVGEGLASSENLIHDLGACRDHRTQLPAVHNLGCSRGSVSDQPGDLLNAYPAMAHQAHERGA